MSTLTIIILVLILNGFITLRQILKQNSIRQLQREKFEHERNQTRENIHHEVIKYLRDNGKG